jgi:hypothetical protein
MLYLIDIVYKFNLFRNNITQMSDIVADNKHNMTPFSIDTPQFDMNKYSGRLAYFFKIFNPR